MGTMGGEAYTHEGPRVGSATTMKKLLLLFMLAIMVGLAVSLVTSQSSPAAPIQEPQVSQDRGLRENYTLSLPQGGQTLPNRNPAQMETAPAVPQTAAVTVRLVADNTGDPVSQGVVNVLTSPKRKVVDTGSVNAMGDSVFQLPPGEFVFLVDPDSLPEGLSPPPLQEQHYSKYWEDYYAPKLRVAAGDNEQVEIRLQRLSRVWGYVFDEDSTPAEDVAVRVRGILRATPQVHLQVETDDHGLYEVELIPGAYRIAPYLFDEGHRLFGVTKPLPQDFVLGTGDNLQIDFSYVQGKCSVTGRLIDLALTENEEEILWSDLRVLALPAKMAIDAEDGHHDYKLNDWVARAFSDETGTFRLTGLAPGRYKLRFAPLTGYDPHSEHSKLGAFSAPMYIELREEGEYAIGDTLLPRARRCEVVGNIVPAKSDGEIPDPNFLEMRVRYPQHYEDERSHTKQVSIEPDGSFSFWVYTSPDSTPATVQVRPRGHTEWVVTQEVEVTPYGHQTVYVQYP